VFSSSARIGAKTNPTLDGHYFVAFFEAAPSPGYGALVIVTRLRPPARLGPAEAAQRAPGHPDRHRQLSIT
jgi:hypothetical protein